MKDFSVYITLKDGNEAAFLKASIANRDAARMEPGNRRFDIYQASDDTKKFLFVEEYDAVESVDRHRETPHFLKWAETATPLMAFPRERVAGTTVPPNYRKRD
jgi:autoinducer 2-degrading protein